MLGPHPMCMIQYNKLLSTCRIPYLKRDTRVKAKRNEDHHIIVIHNNRVCYRDNNYVKRIVFLNPVDFIIIIYILSNYFNIIIPTSVL